MKTKMSLFLFAIAAAGLFAFPSVLATFAGSHTMEIPPTNEYSLDCLKCHQYIATELNATTMASKTLTGHSAAALDPGYLSYMSKGEPGSYNRTYTGVTNDTGTAGSITISGKTFIARGNAQPIGSSSGTIYVITNDTSGNYSGTFYATANWVNVPYVVSGYWENYRTGVAATGVWKASNATLIDANKNGIIENGEVCKLCHLKGYFNIGGGHTGMTVVGCTNDACHGNNNVAGKAYDYFGSNITTFGGSHLGAGWQMSRKQEAHSNFYYGMKAQNSSYVTDDNSTGTATGQVNVSADYYTCLGCHTHVGMKFVITRPAGYDVTMNKTAATLTDYKNSNGAWVTGLDINHTANNFGTDSAGTIVGNASLNTSLVTIIKDPTSAWINNVPGSENRWSP